MRYGRGNRSTSRTRPGGPRRLHGGVRFQSREGPVITTWVGQRWMRFVDQRAPTDVYTEGLELGRQGRTRWIRIEPGAVAAAVQGAGGAREATVRLRVQTFTLDEWDLVCQTLADRAVFSAKMLAGELPVNVEDLLTPLGLRLFPAEDGDLRSFEAEREGWTAASCAVACLFAERLERDPFQIFELRGMRREELQERIRQLRAFSGAKSASGALAYTPRPLPGADAPSPVVDAEIEDFWSLRGDLREIETPMDPPEVSHPLLRRLGVPPFEGARFPLVGLLATCYDLIGAHVRMAADGGRSAECEDEEREV